MWMSIILYLRHSKPVSFLLCTIFSVTEVSRSKKFSSMWIAMSLFSIFLHQNTKSTTVLCIYNILVERLKAPWKICLIDVDSAYHQEAKTIKFIHFFKTCGETSRRRPQDTNLKIYHKTHYCCVFFDLNSRNVLCEIAKN